MYFTNFSIIHLIVISSSSGFIIIIIISVIIIIIVVVVVVSILEGHKYISFVFLVLLFLN